MSTAIAAGSFRSRVVEGVARSELTRLVPLLLQLALALLVIRAYQLESRTFFNVAALAVGGFAVHAILPLRLRLPFFSLLSLGAVVLTFGWVNGAWLIAAGMVLIGVCHLPISFPLRIATLLGIGCVLAASRAGALPSLWAESVWPILASMFMFRIALYLHALRYEKIPASPTRALAYFFMLPNTVFPLFPVVDYATFSRAYYDRDAISIYETGVQWIIRGLIQLILYRFVYLFVVTDPTQLANLGDLLRYLFGTFLLYLRVSGSFHLIVGVLHLFGFRLPETHRLYYLASSFTDFWRRINIYWKDYMMKLVYYPSFFRLRKWGERRALVVATLIVFATTWLLHSYQWFWLRGGFPITAPDILFWGLLGLFVVVNVLRETKVGRKRSLKKNQEAWSLSLALRTTAMFLGMTVLWSLWSSESIGAWVTIWFAAAAFDAGDLLLLVGIVGGFFAIAGRNWDRPVVASKGAVPFHAQPAVRGVALLGGLLLFVEPSLQASAPPRLEEFASGLRQPTLNARDAALQHRGYYEKLDNPSRTSAELWGMMVASRNEDWQEMTTLGLLRLRRDVLQHDLFPNKQVTWNGHLFTTNSWGMHDREYTLQKPFGTYRIALMGQSHVMGSSIENEETFEHILEDRLNGSRGGESPSVEILNFAVSSYSFAQEMSLLQDRALQFDPDMVIMTLPDMSEHRVVTHIMFVLSLGLSDEYPGLRSILERAGVAEFDQRGIPVPSATLRKLAGSFGIDTRMPYREGEQRLRNVAKDILDWSIRESAKVIRAHGATPVLLVLSNVGESSPDGPVDQIETAREAGYIILDLTDVYDGHDPAALRLAPWDNHPNALGNRLIAHRLYEEFQSRRLLPSDLPVLPTISFSDN